MTSSTIPDPTPGQVWEERHGGVAKRRVRISSALFVPETDAVDNTQWRVIVTRHRRRPQDVGSYTALHGRTLRTKWRFIEEAPK